MDSVRLHRWAGTPGTNMAAILMLAWSWKPQILWRGSASPNLVTITSLLTIAGKQLRETLMEAFWLIRSSSQTGWLPFPNTCTLLGICLVFILQLDLWPANNSQDHSATKLRTQIHMQNGKSTTWNTTIVSTKESPQRKDILTWLMHLLLPIEPFSTPSATGETNRLLHGEILLLIPGEPPRISLFTQALRISGKTSEQTSFKTEWVLLLRCPDIGTTQICFRLEMGYWQLLRSRLTLLFGHLLRHHLSLAAICPPSLKNLSLSCRTHGSSA